MNPESERADRTESTEIPANVRETADRLIRAYEREMQESLESYEKSVVDVLERARGDIRRLVGPQNWPTLRRLMRRERLAWRERMQPPDGPLRDLTAEIRTRKEPALKFLDEAGVSPDRLREFVRAQFSHIGNLKLTPATRPGQLYPVPGAVTPPEGPIQLHPVPGAVTPPLGVNPQWFTFWPPFASGYRSSRCVRSPKAYRVDGYPEANLDVLTGGIRNRIYLTVIDASDLDLVHCVLDTGVEFPFTAPAAGTLQIRVDATCGASRHELEVEDEWGVSDSSTVQQNFIMVHVLHPDVGGPVTAETSRLSCNTDVSTYLLKDVLQGQAYATGILSPEGQVASGDTMVIRVGTRSDDATMTNDMEIGSTSTFEWTIKAVHVRVV